MTPKQFKNTGLFVVGQAFSAFFTVNGGTDDASGVSSTLSAGVKAVNLGMHKGFSVSANANG
jgi:hypothetical protein